MTLTTSPFTRHFESWSIKSRRKSVGRRPSIETLEGRQLLTASLTEFAIPFESPVGIVKGSDGNLWVLDSGNGNDGGSVDVVSPEGTLKNVYPIPTADAGATAETLGPDGNIWFVEQYANKIGMITPAGVITEYAIPNTSTTLTNPDGASGLVAAPTSIVAGPDGALWFTEPSAGAIGRITTSGTITQYPTPGLSPQSITVGPDGAIWFTDTSTVNTIDRMSLDGTVTNTYPLPTNFSYPVGLTTGPDGDLYCVEQTTGTVDRITTTGQVTQIPILGNLSSSESVAFDAAGNMWVTGYGSGLAEITPSGQTTIVSLQPASDISTQGLTVGPDGALWFTDTTNNTIGRIDPTTVSSQPTDALLSSDPDGSVSPYTSGSLTFSGTVASFYSGNSATSAADFTATINWGDNSTSAGSVSLASPGQFNVTGTHTYAQDGTDPISVTVVDTNSATTPQPDSLTLTTTMTVSNQTLPIPFPIYNTKVGPVVFAGSATESATTHKAPVVASTKTASTVAKKTTTVTPPGPKIIVSIPGLSTRTLIRLGYAKPSYMVPTIHATQKKVVITAPKPKAHVVVPAPKAVKTHKR